MAMAPMKVVFQLSHLATFSLARAVFYLKVLMDLTGQVLVGGVLPRNLKIMPGNGLYIALVVQAGTPITRIMDLLFVASKTSQTQSLGIKVA